MNWSSHRNAIHKTIDKRHKGKTFKFVTQNSFNNFKHTNALLRCLEKDKIYGIFTRLPFQGPLSLDIVTLCLQNCLGVVHPASSRFVVATSDVNNLKLSHIEDQS